MVNRVRLTAAGNTLAPALSILRKLGYTVTREKSGERHYLAENATCIFSAEDLLSLLGLIRMYEVRSADWQPTDEEVHRLLLLESDQV